MSSTSVARSAGTSTSSSTGTRSATGVVSPTRSPTIRRCTSCRLCPEVDVTSSLLHVATRKGMFVVDGAGHRAHVTGAHFLGDNVTLTLTDPRDGAWYAV